MTQIAHDQQQWIEAATASVATKLHAFHQGLTPDEQQVLGAALRHLDVRPVDTTQDVHGYRDIIQWKPTIVECVVWQEQVRSLVEVLTLGLVSNFTPGCEHMPIPSQPA